jgi:hyperosmotically inducible protein
MSDPIGWLQEAGDGRSPELGSSINQRTDMKTTKLLFPLLMLLAIGTMVGCRGGFAKSPDVSGSIRKSLDQAGLKEVTVNQNRDKGIVTLGGQVASESDKYQAESLARSLAGTQVVADQIAVIPPGSGKEIETVNSDLDQGIEKNLDAALIQNRMHDDVKYEVKNGVVTLNGDVNSEHMRTDVEKIASSVPNVKQVVNALQVVKRRKASSSQ